MPLCRVKYPPATTLEGKIVTKAIPVPDKVSSSESAMELIIYNVSKRLSHLVAANLSEFTAINSSSQNGSENFSDFGGGGSVDTEEHIKWGVISEIQLIKAVVLMVVISLLLVSTCTVVFRTFSLFSGKRDDLQI